ncbi:MAG: hypothetical protein ACR2O4_10825 [Hyphomicrobiaceae bacterium]
MRQRVDDVRRLGFLALFCFLAAAGTGFTPLDARAQTTTGDTKLSQEEKQRADAVEALQTLASLLTSRKEQVRNIDALKNSLRKAKEDASKAELEEQIKMSTDKLKRIDAQISALSTGASTDQINIRDNKKFDLTAELLSLAEPFVRMMKDATENARRIEELRGILETAGKRKKIAERALQRLTVLTSANKSNKSADAKSMGAHLKGLIGQWRKQLVEAEDLREATEQQLGVRLDEEASASGGLGNYATQFFRNRGLNLLLAILACCGVFLVMNLIARAAEWLRRRRSIARTFATRLVNLLHMLTTFVLAFLAMLAVFNAMHDWLLIGIASVFAVAAAWIGMKMLPNVVEQVTLLLNLGAVQEGERVMYGGVPWLVKRLDFYTDLVNPELDGGTFTMPARELIGLHSRPAARNESWFPTSRGDWVQLPDERIGKVTSQTPELVQIEELGGAIRTFQTAAFVAEAPRNLSHGFRIKTELGLDYQHQPLATDQIPHALKKHVANGLADRIAREGVKNVDVDLLRLADSSIVFEVEVDLVGNLASRYEDIEREIARLLVDACNTHGWVVPFPQLVVHREQ